MPADLKHVAVYADADSIRSSPHTMSDVRKGELPLREMSL